MHIQIQFFEGKLEDIQSKYNDWSKDKYIHESSLHFRRNDTAVLKVQYGQMGARLK